ncbi:hypothetical protein KIN20_001572 [Parelaphostrongylus tenuis]|uniref:Uncharacterized protein n=1 Tax=Parelaphostrongylus tenuis TaxID=148309 RepID=A0AAD5LYI6_PARTN|nr:hypothetical protein KIN20_001572 [Parelaphostrongylus tenuis]
MARLQVVQAPAQFLFVSLTQLSSKMMARFEHDDTCELNSVTLNSLPRASADWSQTRPLIVWVVVREDACIVLKFTPLLFSSICHLIFLPFKPAHNFYSSTFTKF